MANLNTGVPGLEFYAGMNAAIQGSDQLKQQQVQNQVAQQAQDGTLPPNMDDKLSVIGQDFLSKGLVDQGTKYLEASQNQKVKQFQMEAQQADTINKKLTAQSKIQDSAYDNLAKANSQGEFDNAALNIYKATGQMPSWAGMQFSPELKSYLMQNTLKAKDQVEFSQKQLMDKVRLRKEDLQDRRDTIRLQIDESKADAYKQSLERLNKVGLKPEAMFREERALKTDYDKNTKSIQDDLRSTELLRQLLTENTPVSDPQVQKLLTGLYGKAGSVRSVALYKDEKSFGSYAQKFSDLLNRITSGRYSDTDREQIKGMIDDTQNGLLIPALNTQKQWYTGVAKRRDLDPQNIIGPDAYSKNLPESEEATAEKKSALKSSSRQGGTSNAAWGNLENKVLDAQRQVESGGNVNAVSPKGALGPYQIMPATARMLGIQNPKNEKEARAGASNLMSYLMTKYNNNLDKALAAYNWGEGNVDKKGMEHLPQETRDYIQRVHSHMDKGPVETKFSNENKSWAPYIVDQFKVGLNSMRELSTAVEGKINKLTSVPADVAAVAKIMLPGVKLEESLEDKISEKYPELIKALKSHGVAPIKDITGGVPFGERALGGIAQGVGASIPIAATAGVGGAGLEAVANITAGGIGAGLTSEEAGFYGRKLFEKMGLNPDTGEEIFSTAGAFIWGAGAGTALAGAEKAAGKVAGKASKLLPAGQREEAARRVAEEASKTLEGDVNVPPNLQQASEVSSRVPGFKPAIPEASGSEILLGKKRQVVTDTPEALKQAHAERQMQNQAIQEFTEKNFPKNTASVVEQTEGIVTEQQKALSASEKAIERKIRTEEAKYPQQERPENVTEELRNLRNQAEKVSRDQKNSLYNNFYKTAEAEKIKAPAIAGGNKLRTLGVDEAQTINAEAPLSPRDWHSLYKGTNREYIQALEEGKRTGNYSRSQELKPFYETFSKQSEAFSKSGTPSAKAFNAANKYYKDVYRPRFLRGLGEKIIHENSFEEISKGTSKLSGLIYNKETVTDFVNLYGQNPQALAALRRGMIDDFARAAVTEKGYNPAAAHAWLQKNSSVLSFFPQIKTDISNSTKMIETLGNAKETLAQQSSAIDKGIIGSVLKTQDTDAAVATVMRDPQQLSELSNFLKGNKQVAKSFARDVLDKLIKQPDAEQWMKANETKIKPVFDSLGKNTYQNAKDIIAMNKILSRFDLPTRVTPKETISKLADITGTDAKGWVAKTMPTTIDPRTEYKLVNLASRFFLRIRDKETQRLEHALVFDTNLRYTMENLQKTGPSESMLKELQRQLVISGFRASELYYTKDKTLQEENKE